MATKVDPASSVEPGRIRSTVSMSTSSVASASSPKVSMFGKKSGFVIPKNKLSGSLVPIYRGGAKVEGGSSVKEEGTKQVQRKTKWGVDLTQEVAVRKGRALAYQTRLEQITQQLSSGALEIADDQDSQSPKQAGLNDENHERSLKRIDSLKIEALDLERREVIGEILRLNPSYKTPLDYKPLLKEAKVPVPVANKAYPGYNFIGLLLGPESNTQKRLEEETGAKVRVQGTKVDAGEKREITLLDITDAQGTQDLFVHVSADTYEKVDAAVALIELLLTPVSGGSAVASTNSSSAAGDSTMTSVYVTPPMTIVSQGVLQPAFMPVQPAPAQFHPYHAPWFQTAPSSGPPPPSGFMPMHMPNNLIRFPPSPVGPVSQPYFGQPPFGSLPRTQSPPANRPQLLMQVMQQPPNQGIGHQNRPMQGPQPPPAYSVMRPHPNITAPPFTSAQPMPAGSLQMSGPPLTPNSGSAHSGPLSNMPLRAPGPPGNSPGWPTPPVVSAPLRPNNVTQMAPPSINTPARPPQLGFPNNMTARLPAVNFAQPTTYSLRPSTAPPSFSSASMVPSSSGPQLSATMPALAPMSMAAATPTQLPHSSAPQRPAFPTSAPFMAQTSMPPTQSGAPLTASSPASLPLASPVPGPAVRPVQSPHPLTVPGSSSGTMPSFSPVTSVATTPVGPIPPPTITAPKPVRPSSGDFTFQPLRTQVPASPTTPGANSPSVKNTTQVQLVAPQVPSFRPAGQNSAPAPQMGSQGWPMAAIQTVPSHSPLRPPPSTSAPFSVNPTNMGPPPPFPNPRSGPSLTQMGPPSFSPAPRAPNSPASQMGRPVFSPAPAPPATQMGGPVYPPSPQAPNLSSSFAARPYNPLQPYQNQLPPASRPSSITPLNQQFHSNPFSPVAGRPSASAGANQIYDPFSPTSITPSPQQQGGDSVKAARKPETDAEYEDLMASVGVK